jgi:hypothetical protein
MIDRLCGFFCAGVPGRRIRPKLATSDDVIVGVVWKGRTNFTVHGFRSTLNLVRRGDKLLKSRGRILLGSRTRR